MKNKITQILKIILIATIILMTLVMSFASVSATSNQLDIKSVDVYVNDDHVDEDDEIDVNDGDDVRIVIVLENNYDEDDNIQIEDAYFELDCGNDWDFADGEESDNRNIDENDEEEFEISFTIDSDDIDDETIDMKIKAYGDDEEDSDFEHTAEETLEFNLDQPSDAVKFTDIDFREDSAYTNGFIFLDMGVTNYGSNDQDEVEVRVFSAEDQLDYYSNKLFSLDEGDDKEISFSIPTGTVAGEYKIEVALYDDKDHEEDYMYMYITVIGEDNSANSEQGSEENGEQDDSSEDNSADNESNNEDHEIENNEQEEEEEEEIIVILTGENLTYQEPEAGNYFFGSSFWFWLRGLLS